jgi:hypothetical protein
MSEEKFLPGADCQAGEIVLVQFRLPLFRITGYPPPPTRLYSDRGDRQEFAGLVDYTGNCFSSRQLVVGHTGRLSDSGIRIRWKVAAKLRSLTG